MSLSDIYSDLRDCSTPSDAAIIFRSLRYDSIIQKAFENASFRSAVREWDEDSLTKYSPANLGLFACGSIQLAIELNDPTFPELHSDIKQNALTFMRETLRGKELSLNLKEAGLFALAWRERRKQTGNWSNFESELTSVIEKHPSSGELIQTAINILAGIIPDPVELWRYLQANEHTLPEGIGAAKSILVQTAENQIKAHWAYQVWRDDFQCIVKDFDEAGGGEISELIQKEIPQPEIRKEYEVNYEDNEGIKSTKKHLATLIQRELVTGSGDSRDIKLLPLLLTQTELASVLDDLALRQLAGDYSEDLINLYKEFDHPLAVVLQSKELDSNNKAKIDAWIDNVEINRAKSSRNDAIITLIEKLDSAGMRDGAEKLALKYLAIAPENKALLSWQADSAASSGREQQALDLYSQLSIFYPEDATFRRKIASMYLDRGDWELAFKEFRRLSLDPNSEQVDITGYLESGYKSGHLDEVRTFAKKLLESNSENGDAWFYLGLTQKSVKDLADALDSFTKVTEIIPEKSAAWAELASTYEMLEDEEKRLETLRTALTISPNSSNLNYSIGRLLYDHGQTAESLPYLKSAAKLSPESPKIALQLVESMSELGFQEEASQFLAEASGKWPHEKELSFLQAKSLHSIGRLDEAQKNLEAILKSGEVKASWLIEYAKVLKDQANENKKNNQEANRITGKIIKALSKAITIDPANFEAQLLLIENEENLQSMEENFSRYSKLMQNTAASSDDWYGRVQAGFGKAALKLGQVESAIAALSNAQASMPGDVSLLKGLAEAYAEAGLKENSLETAKKILNISEPNLETQKWYANLLVKNGAQEESVKLLEDVLQQDSKNLRLRLLLAKEYLAINEDEKARDHLDVVRNTKPTTAEEKDLMLKTFVELGDWDTFERILVDGSERLPEDKLIEVAALFKQHNQLARAGRYLDEAIELNPQNSESYILKGEVSEKLGNKDEAKVFFEKAYEIIYTLESTSEASSIKDNGVVRDKLLDLYKRSGEFEKAYRLMSENEVRISKTKSNLSQRLELARILNRTGEIENILEELEEVEGNDGNTLLECYLRTLRLLESNNFEKAEEILTDCSSSLSSDAAIDLLNSQVQFRLGRRSRAEHLFANSLGKEINRDTSIDLLIKLETCKDLNLWNDGESVAQDLLREFGSEPVVQYSVAQFFVQEAEWRSIASKIFAQKRLPSEKIVSTERYQSITELIKHVSDYVNPSDLVKWDLRAKLAFQPEIVDIEKILESNTVTNSDIAASISALIRIGQSEHALGLADTTAESSISNLPLVLIDDSQLDVKVLEALKVALSFDNPVGAAALAVQYYKCGEFLDSQKCWDRAISYWPDEPQWLVQSSNAAIALNDLKKASEMLQQAIEILPNQSLLHGKLGGLLLQQEFVDSAIDQLKISTQLSPTNGEAWLNLAKAYMRKNDLKNAKASADKAVQWTNRSVTSLILSGQIALLNGDEKYAAEYSKEAQRIGSDDLDLVLLNAKLLQAKGKDTDALELLSSITGSHGESLSLKLEIARLIYKLQGSASAVKYLHPLAERYPDNDLVIGAYASSLAECGLFSEAEKAAKQALEINPDKPELKVMLGRLYANSGHFQEALRYILEAKNEVPESSEMYMDLGKIYMAQNDLNSALESYDKAIQINPDDYRPYYESALIQRGRKDYVNAENMMRKAAHLRPSDVNIKRQLGAIVALNLVQNAQESTNGSKF